MQNCFEQEQKAESSLGAARGFAHIREHADSPVIHRDIKIMICMVCIYTSSTNIYYNRNSKITSWNIANAWR